MKPLEELKKLEKDKLEKELAETMKDLFKAKFEIKNEQSKNNHHIRNYKKHIARIKTLINLKCEPKKA